VNRAPLQSMKLRKLISSSPAAAQGNSTIQSANAHATSAKPVRTYLVPIAFHCPCCKRKVKSKGEQIFCHCISIPYKGRLDGVIPRPDEIIPSMIEGKRIDVLTLVEETAFRWGRLVARQRSELCSADRSLKPPSAGRAFSGFRLNGEQGNRLRLTAALSAELGVWLEGILSRGSLASQRLALLELRHLIDGNGAQLASSHANDLKSS
jgi:hypothetical protein